MALKTNRPSPTELLSKSKSIRVYQLNCSLCRFREFVTLFDGETTPENVGKLGRVVSSIPESCPLCGAPLKKIECPIFTKES